MFRTSFARILLVAAGVLSFAIAVVGAQQPQGAAGQRGGQPPAPQGPFAPEKYKNIQVLTDVPADQLDLAMRYVSASTGLQCITCHVQDQATGEWAYDKDDKRGKQTAREMMKMVKAINAGNFGITANCGTCHQGRNQPAGLQLAQPLTPEQLAAMAQQQAGRQGPPPGGAPGGAAGGAAGGGAPGGGRGQQGPPPPAVDDVLTKYIDALGGQAALEKLQSRVMSGTLTQRTGQAVAFTIEQKGNRYRETAQAQPAAMTRGFDGTSGWVQVGDRTTDVTGFPLQQALREGDLTLALHLKDKYPALQSARPARLDGKDVNLLRGTANGVTETFYFDAASGLLVRRTISTTTPLGRLPEQIDYADYRDVAGVKTPFEVKRSTWSTIDLYKIVDVKPNAQIDDARFAKPKG
jgi:hypothetical protein